MNVLKVQRRGRHTEHDVTENSLREEVNLVWVWRCITFGATFQYDHREDIIVTYLPAMNVT